MTTGALLKSLRKGQNLSQMDVARWFKNKTAQYVSNIERGACGMPTHWIPTLAKKFNVSTEQFILMMVEEYREFLRRKIK